MNDTPEILWSPPDDVLATSEIGSYLAWLATTRGLHFGDYEELWRWSTEDLNAFWASVWDYFGVADGERTSEALLNDELPGAELPGVELPGRWFPGTTLNYAAEAFRRLERDAVAVISRVQGEEDRHLSASALEELVARCRSGLLAQGVARGDVVGGYIGNRVEALVGFLAAASLGAVWTCCPPEFGAEGAISRLAQVAPKVLIATAGYRFGDKLIDRNDDLREIVAALPDRPVVAIVEVPGIETPRMIPDAQLISWGQLLDHDEVELTVDPVPFDHPLYVLFSSGTTGRPKAIVHGHGGIILEHLKALSLHLDLRAGDRFFWFSTTGWMMWNFLVSGLLVGSTVVLFDGDPSHDDLGALWAAADELDVTYFGTSAPFLLACRARGMTPSDRHDLSSLRGVGSTGAPLPAEGYRWTYDHVSPTAVLSSISGGTDVCTAFLGGVPLKPVEAGRMSCRYLGAAVDAVDEDGTPVRNEPGELVITRPLPSMPVGFWGDSDGRRYHEAYFAERPGMWTHGDWLSIADDGSSVITGRSDATLNRGGVRLGTAEFYSVVERRDEVEDSLVVHLEDPEGGPGTLILFVVPSPDAVITDEVIRSIRSEIRTQLSPRHLPDSVHDVAAIPRTRSGKKLEIPVKRILLGATADEAVGRDGVADRTHLEPFERLARSNLTAHTPTAHTPTGA